MVFSDENRFTPQTHYLKLRIRNLGLRSAPTLSLSLSLSLCGHGKAARVACDNLLGRQRFVSFISSIVIAYVHKLIG